MSAGYKFDASAQLDLPHAELVYPLCAVMSYVFLAPIGRYLLINKLFWYNFSGKYL